MLGSSLFIKDKLGSLLLVNNIICAYIFLSYQIMSSIVYIFFVSVSKPAPAWEGTAVVDGQFQELKLTDYRGKYLVFFFYPLDL